MSLRRPTSDVHLRVTVNSLARSCLLLLFGVLSALLLGCSERLELKSDSLRVEINDRGRVTGISDVASGRDFLVPARSRERDPAQDEPTDFDAVGRGFRTATGSLLSIRVDGVMIAPRSAAFDREAGTISLLYATGHNVTISFEEEASHIRFAVAEATPNESIELVAWGPFPTRLNEVIGETIGVVQGEGFALGIQGLNPKSLGGFPWNENDAMPQIDIFEGEDYSDLSPEGKRYVLYRVEAAKPDVFGSTLQVYTRNRNTDRVIPNRGYDRYVAPAFDDGGVVGSSVALFGAAADSVLDAIGRIEIAEGLPHPTIDGVWGKKARSANAAYLIMPFSEADHERVIDTTLRAGLRYLYHPGPFKNWGHFELDPESFPNGVDGLKRVVDRAAESGIMVGVHTLSNFLTPNDPYASPVPDPRLAKVGETTLSRPIDATTTTIPIASPDFYEQDQESFLNASMIGEELVRCPGFAAAGVTDDWALVDCERGAYGTQAANHAANETIARLDDHAYKVFLTNAELSVEMATNLADLFNEAGLRQISFDGLEGNRSTGMGNYGEILFTNTWYERLNDDIRNHYIADASRTSHFFWHVYSRMNWGEPWYAGFRESQTEYRLKNQPYFQRNLMPAMLGWFSMRPETSTEDIEWMLARSAGFDAGYGFVTDFEALDANGSSGTILELLGLWEEARMADVFPDSLKKQMQDISNEYHLERTGESGYWLYPITSIKAVHSLRQRQPGEPEATTIRLERPAGGASGADDVMLLLSAVGADVSDVELTFDGGQAINLNSPIRDGEHIRIKADGSAIRYSSTWRVIDQFMLSAPLGEVGAASSSLDVRSSLPGLPEAQLKVEVRLVGDAYVLSVAD